MDILPILRALARNKTGALLIGLQIALTLAILCNSLSITQQLSQRMRQFTGIDESNILILSTQFVDDPPDLRARLEGDLAALRSLPGVVDADTVISFPLSGYNFATGLSLTPNQKSPTAGASLLHVGEHGLNTWGLKLVAGRWFQAGEVTDLHYYENKVPPVVVVTRNLAHALFPQGNALGQQVWFTATQGARIIGIVENVWQGSVESFIAGNGIFLPALPINKGATYMIRTRPGAQAAVIRAAQDRLFQLVSQRVISNVLTFPELRQRNFQLDRAVSVVLSVVCALLLVVTACGIIGLTTYWVAQRRQQIGMRRALGARRRDILYYFQTENLMIAGFGALLGIALGVAVNLLLAGNLELTRLGAGYICGGALIMVALCQAAVLWPALRAASIPPAVATRAL